MSKSTPPTCAVRTDVQAGVSTKQITVKGNSVNAWVLTYTGTTTGQFYNSLQVYSIGPETDTNFYDPTYGIWLGATFNATAKGHEANFLGAWTDGYFEQDYFSDTSLPLSTTPVPEFGNLWLIVLIPLLIVPIVRTKRR